MGRSPEEKNGNTSDHPTEIRFRWNGERKKGLKGDCIDNSGLGLQKNQNPIKFANEVLFSDRNQRFREMARVAQSLRYQNEMKKKICFFPQCRIFFLFRISPRNWFGGIVQLYQIFLVEIVSVARPHLAPTCDPIKCVKVGVTLHNFFPYYLPSLNFSSSHFKERETVSVNHN